MKLSPGEKLILLALAAAKDGKEDINLDFIRSAILNGQTWAISWELSGIPTEETDERIASETAGILSMWEFIEFSVAQLSPAEREALEKDAYPHDLAFEGFDGNHDPHFSVASFFIQDMNRFDKFRGRSLNSHSQASLPKYRRMKPLYDEALRSNGFGSETLSAGTILSIVKPK